MANVLELKHLSNSVSRNGFDLSARTVFSAKVGEILPFFTLDVLPGDNITLNPSHFTRTMPVNTAAYTDIKEYVHFYYVPYTLLYSDIREFFSENSDNSLRASSLSKKKDIGSSLPYLSFVDIARYIYTCATKKTKDVCGFEHANGVCKLLEYLGYGDFYRFLTHSVDTYSSTLKPPTETNPDYKDPIDPATPIFDNSQTVASSNYNERLSPLPLLAFQKIYQDYFRNKQWEKANPASCNIDYMPFNSLIPINTLSSSYASGTTVNDLFSPRYCDFAKDYFFGILPRAQYGDSAVAPLSMSSIPKNALKPVNTHDDIYKFFKENPSYGASVIALRKAEALQRYREIKQTGISDYKSFLDKIFNVNISEFQSGLCNYLGGYDVSVNISEVVNTSLSSDDAVADIKGKGTSSGNGQSITFESKDYGIIIGVYTARPFVEYDLTASSKSTQRVDLEDFANPVFDNIGMQTVHFNEIIQPFDYSYRRVSEAALSGQSSPEYLKNVADKALRSAYSPVGYVPRYMDYKTNYNKIRGEFRNTLSSWVSPVKSSYIYNGLLTSPSELLPSVLSYKSFKVNPSLLNSIFVQNVDSTLSTDQLLVNMYVGCPCVRNLDYDGLPY